MTSPTFVKVSALLELSPVFRPSAVVRVLAPTQFDEPAQRLRVVAIDSPSDPHANWLWAIPGKLCGDSSALYHPKFLMALLASLPIQTHNSQNENILEWRIPEILFLTNGETRRSMTLNGMRMSTEYFASGSMRVFQLIEQRLQAGQSDVVHDILVYLTQRTLELSAAFEEERTLLGESIAAYLGLNTTRVQELLAAQLKDELWGDCRLESAPIAREIEQGCVGIPRSQVNIVALIENQAARFEAVTSDLQSQHTRVLQLIDGVVQRLYRGANGLLNVAC